MIGSPQGLSLRTLTHGGNGAVKRWVFRSSHIHPSSSSSSSSYRSHWGVAATEDYQVSFQLTFLERRSITLWLSWVELSWLLALMLEEEEEAAGAFVKECTDLSDITSSFTTFRVLSVWVFELKWYLWLNMRYLSTCHAVIDYLIYFTEGLSDW